VAPLLLLITLGAFDLLRSVQISNTTADAARQGARQAVAYAVSGDAPFGSSNGLPCSGTTITASATGTGCLTDARIAATVESVLGSTVSSSSVSTNQPSACPTPQPGAASICIYPAQGVYPTPGTRITQWTNQQRPATMVSVTVVVHYSPITPVVGGLFPSTFLLKSATSMIPEY
jgi:hypothetical protein